MFSLEGDRPFGLAENLHSLPITCAVFADEATLITGSQDTTVCVWQVRLGKTFEIQLKECLRGHTARVTTLAFSRSFSIIVSGADDGRGIIWDLNRLKYVRQLKGHAGPVEVFSHDVMNTDDRLSRLTMRLGISRHVQVRICIGGRLMESSSRSK